MSRCSISIVLSRIAKQFPAKQRDCAAFSVVHAVHAASMHICDERSRAPCDRAHKIMLHVSYKNRSRKPWTSGGGGESITRVPQHKEPESCSATTTSAVHDSQIGLDTMRPQWIEINVSRARVCVSRNTRLLFLMLLLPLPSRLSALFYLRNQINKRKKMNQESSDLILFLSTFGDLAFCTRCCCCTRH